MKQEVKITKSPFKEDVFYIDHALPFTKSLIVWYNRNEDTLHLSEDKGEMNEKTHKSKPIFSPIFDNAAICMACGKDRYVNTCGFCEQCWVTFSHLRKGETGEER